MKILRGAGAVLLALGLFALFCIVIALIIFALDSIEGLG